MKFWFSFWAFLFVLFTLGLSVLAFAPGYVANHEYNDGSNRSTGMTYEGGSIKGAIVKTAAKPLIPQVPSDPAPLDQMIGQMLMLGFKGTQSKHEGVRQVKQLLSKGLIGGLIFMGANLENKAQVKQLVTFLKPRSPLKLLPFIGIDQEGGAVQRLGQAHGFTDIPKADSLAETISPKQALKVYDKLAGELAAVGFNINFGPVVDLNLVPTNPIIGMKGRSYGKSASKVEDYARAFVLAHRQHNLLTSLKHFPGHGSSWTDSHEQFVDLSASWRKDELKPYKSMVRNGLVDMVMVGHLYHPQFSDGDKIPASLSHKAIEGKLRREIGFQGLVITDDLGMGAIRKNYKFPETIIRAIQAGNDILLLVDDKLATPSKIEEIHMIIRHAIRDKRISLKRITKSYRRIVATKRRLEKQIQGHL